MVDRAESGALPPRRSEFVSVLSWILIILFGFMLAGVIMQLVMIETLFPKEAFEQAPPPPAEMPGFFRFMFGHFKLLIYANAAMIGLWFAGGLGLRKRREWARRLVSGLFFLGAFMVLAMPALQIHSFSTLSEIQREKLQASPAGENPDCKDPTPGSAEGGDRSPPGGADPAGFLRVLHIVEAVAIIFSAAIASLFVFLGWKLRTAKIRAEFS
jgi:hypothetical protein